MLGAGILEEDDAVELLEGWIVQKMPHNPPHDVALALGELALRTCLPSGWHVRQQSAITTADSEPESDLAVVRGDIRRYVSHHPQPEDVAIVIEVADSSLHRDREDKGRLYSAAGIVVYWIINLVDARVEVYGNPGGATSIPAFLQHDEYDANQSVPVVLSGRQIALIAVRDLLP